MDSGFWSAKLIWRLRGHRVRYSITVRQTETVRAAIAAIPEAAWVPIAYHPDGVAQVAETPYRSDRLIVRRVRNQGDQAQLIATWRYQRSSPTASGRCWSWTPTIAATPCANGHP
jgi:hypothetical protein